MSVMTVEAPMTREEVAEHNQRGMRGMRVYDAIGIGLLTADNIDEEDRWSVAEMWRHAPIFDSKNGRPVMTGFGNNVEGKDWCWATTSDGTFGTFSLDQPSRTFLESATFHLWITDGALDPQDIGRVDFTDLGEYQDAALELMHGAGVNHP